jgi:hypothetical protein
MTTQTTAEAARHAGVTTATIRTWCRIGAVSAVKVSGRWVIDTDSLRHRIALTRRTVQAQLAAFTDAKTAQAKAEEIVLLGGQLPQRLGRVGALFGDGLERGDCLADVELVFDGDGDPVAERLSHLTHRFHGTRTGRNARPGRAPV